MKHPTDRPTDAERCARCADVQDELIAVARRSNNLDQFFGQARARAAEVGAELESLTGNGDVTTKRIPVDVEDDTESWLAFEGR